MWLSLIIDGVMAALLLTTIHFTWTLNKRLAVLRTDRERMEGLIIGLKDASAQAEAAVAGLREAARDSGRALQDRIDKAIPLQNDLGFIIDRATSAADRLEAVLKHQRDAGPAPGPSAAPAPARKPAAAESPRPAAGRAAPGRPEPPVDERAQQSRLAALLRQAEEAPTPPMRTEPRGEPSLDPTRARTSPAEPPAASPDGRPQSRAERELQRALEGRR